MPCTARDCHSLDRALERHAEWKAELRRLHLADELLALPLVVGALTREVREFAAGQARLIEEVRALAPTQSLPTRPLARATLWGLLAGIVSSDMMVTPAGFEPAISTLKGSRPGPG